MKIWTRKVRNNLTCWLLFVLSKFYCLCPWRSPTRKHSTTNRLNASNSHVQQFILSTVSFSHQSPIQHFVFTHIEIYSFSATTLIDISVFLFRITTAGDLHPR